MQSRNNSRVTVKCLVCGETERVLIQPDSFDAVDGSNSGIVYCSECNKPMEPVEP